MFQMTPAVFVVGREYHIMLPVDREVTMWVKVGNKTYYDQSNGILRSNNYVHKVSVPMKELDRKKQNTVYLRTIVNRKPYFTETAEVEVKEYEFHPVCGESVRAYHISDAHNCVEEPVKAAKLFGDIDFLILNGDIPDHCGEERNVLTIYRLISELTHGCVPTVFSRGNHDMRGKYAEKFAEYTPCENGRSYYTFRLGGIWGLILDCGEDKMDEHAEYGHTICCHDFRERETEYIRKVIATAEEEYESNGVTHKMVVVHNPFTRKYKGMIEEEIYEQWAVLLKEYVKPHFILCGHTHKYEIYPCGNDEMLLAQPCAVVVGSERRNLGEDAVLFGGVGLEFDSNGIMISYTNSVGERKETVRI